MTNKNQLLEQIQASIIESLNPATGEGISQNDLAKRAKVSGATLSQIKAGNWAEISDEMTRKLMGFFRIGTDTEWQLFETPNYRTVVRLCEDARRGWMLGLAAGTGNGKTTALRDYAKRNKANTFYVLSTIVMSPIKFLHAMQAALGQSPANSREAALDAIVDKLSKIENPLLIIDDAGKLNTENDRKKEVMPLIQVLFDAYEDRNARRLGVVVSGTEQMKKRLQALALHDRNAYPELVSRIRCWQGLDRPNAATVAEIARHHGIEDAAAIKVLRNLADNYRRLRDLIVTAKQVSLATGREITAELLHELQIGDLHYQNAQ